MEDWKEFSAKTADEALTNALIQLETSSDQIEYEVIEEEKSGVFGLFSKPARIRVRKKEQVVDRVYDFLKRTFDAMHIDVAISHEMDEIESTLSIELKGNDMGMLIGKRGQTLDAVQYLASIVQNKNSETHCRVIINAEKYREKREKTLQMLARRLADKCIKSGKSVRLEPMNPYERKVIHSTLQSNPKVTTRSEGTEPNRRVVIELKR